MLDLGFREDLEFILDATPQERRTLLFSATIPKNIAALARRYQRDAVRIDTLVAEPAPRRHRVPGRQDRAQRDRARRRQCAALLRKPRRDGLLPYPRSRQAPAREPASSGASRRSPCRASSARTSAAMRCRRCAMGGPGSASPPTSPPAGIDLPDLGLVIHAELPNDHETLLHRSGRTGRAGRKGVCVMLVPYTRRRKAERLVDEARIDVDLGRPALGRGNPAARPGASPERSRLFGGVIGGRSGHGPALFSPSAPPKTSPRPWSAPTAPACPRPRRCSTPGRSRCAASPRQAGVQGGPRAA